MLYPNPHHYEALLIVSFGGPEGMAEVIPFLENVLRGRNIPRERMLAVAHHYELFGGVSPLNAQNRALIAALETEFAAHGLDLPIYWGNRNWRPLLTETIQQMADDGVKKALAFFTTAYSSYSSCRQYLENIAEARAAVGPKAPEVHKLRAFYNHPGFIEPNIERVQEALAKIPANRQAAAQLVFTAHSIPLSMARTGLYEEQLAEICRLVAAGAGRSDWQLVYQSRSGPPGQPWLEPDIGAHLSRLKAEGVEDVVVAPIGFISDHMEVIYDLDTEARALAQEMGLNLIRAGTVGVHPAFIHLIHELVAERLSDAPQRRALGRHGPSHDFCPADCCPPPVKPAGGQGGGGAGEQG